ncbi:MAG: hypothetical protein ACO1OQ_12190 [Rufibacter sp.]
MHLKKNEMSKKVLALLAIIVLFSCEQKPQEKQLVELNEKVEEQPAVKQTTEIGTTSKGKSWLNPEFLSADFNGDGFSDTAYAIILDNKKGIRISHGNTTDEFVIGAGKDFGNGGDDFDWVENWNIVKEKSTYEVTFKENGDIDGGREVKLDHTAFYIGAEEVGGATIAWKDGKYVWIHQAH